MLELVQVFVEIKWWIIPSFTASESRDTSTYLNILN